MERVKKNSENVSKSVYGKKNSNLKYHRPVYGISDSSFVLLLIYSHNSLRFSLLNAIFSFLHYFTPHFRPPLISLRLKYSEEVLEFSIVPNQTIVRHTDLDMTSEWDQVRSVVNCTDEI